MKRSRPAARSRRSWRESLPARQPVPTAAQWREILLKDLRQRVPQGSCPVCQHRRLTAARTVCSPRCQRDLTWAAKARAQVEHARAAGPLLHAREFSLLRQFLGRKPDAIAKIIRIFLQKHPTARTPEVWAHLRELARQGTHPVILAVGPHGGESEIGLARAHKLLEVHGQQLQVPTPERCVVWQRPRDDRPIIMMYPTLDTAVKNARRYLRKRRLL